MFLLSGQTTPALWCMTEALQKVRPQSGINFKRFADIEVVRKYCEELFDNNLDGLL